MIITGRKLRSIKRLRNKKLGELQRKMSRCKKGSRQWKKYRRAKLYLLSKSDRQLTDALHKTTKQFVDWARTQCLKQVTFGDVEGVQRHTRARKNKPSKKQPRSRKHNQRMSQWTFGKLYAYLEYKLAAHGITITKQDERYTSQTCPVCGRRKKAAGRIYQCFCGYHQHRDLHGAANQLALVLHGKIQSHPFTIEKPTYLRIA
ncbi:transposase [Aneurinibacillus sp. Ricciae_BoGa-3]|uniref:RNA-guided endonuclease InsQ/TnpB family protein n=1 Tax=Aneurinibacillus sp. Ricciae_BoGa-3 TaxID=3022697 RepID=UPI002340EB14|nr:transposase [Aneurinibacillus sp. Ricciae_BoGa-3]WCK54223.1 transposase [Aneurinibacillus sp. Ricciae_BoGa-3]